MNKVYNQPEFGFVSTDGQCRAFLAASDAPAAGPTATLGPVIKTQGTW